MAWALTVSNAITNARPPASANYPPGDIDAIGKVWSQRFNYVKRPDDSFLKTSQVSCHRNNAQKVERDVGNYPLADRRCTPADIKSGN